MQKLKQILKDSMAKQGLVLAAGGFALLLYSIVGQLSGRMGSWGASPYLFPAGAATLLLAAGLRLIWVAVRHPSFMEPGGYDTVLDELAAEDYEEQEAELLHEVALLNDDPPADDADDDAPTVHAVKSGDGVRVLLTLALTVLYCIAMPYAGFLLATIAYLFVLPLVLGEKNRLAALTVAVITAATIYLIFGAMLGVILP